MAWKDIHTNLWYYDYSQNNFGVPMKSKTIAVKLSNKSMVVISPGNPVEKIDPEFGSVDFIVVPNSFQQSYLTDWASTYPKAKLFAPKGVQKKIPNT